MAIVVSHPTGNANLREVLKAFDRNRLLTEFETTLGFEEGERLLQIIPALARKELLRRTFPLRKNQIHNIPAKEILRQLALKINISSLTRHEVGMFSVDAVYQNFDHEVSKRIKHLNHIRKVDAVYAYDDGALETFRTSANLGIKKYYDLPIGYWRAARNFLESERANRPEWADTIKVFSDSPEKLARKDEELALADHIFVASTFTRDSLKLYPGPLAPVSVIPYGFPEVATHRSYRQIGHSPLRVLFVGGLSQRKGLANVLDATNQLGSAIELTVIGRASGTTVEALKVGLKPHRHLQSLPHHEILLEMRAHDILVFPSLFEGFGLVITEAMSQGTPVITTERTCGPDFIVHGENGWIIEAGQTEALRRQLEEIIENPESVAILGKAAMRTASTRPWQVYGDELVRKILELR